MAWSNVGNIKGPKGDAGEDGANGTNGSDGAAATIAVGTVTTGTAGSSASVTNAGTSNAAVLNFTIPRGDQGVQGIQGIQGDVGPVGPAVISALTARSPAFGTAYQTQDTSKPSFISAMIDTAYTVTVASTIADTVELRVGANQAQVAAGTGGSVAATFRTSVTGIALAIGLGIGQRGQLTAWVPSGWYWALRRTQGTAATITSATEQTLG